MIEKNVLKDQPMVIKHLIKLIFFTLFLISLCTGTGFSADYDKSTSNGENLEVIIKFFNQKIYYLNSPIIVEFKIINRSPDPYLFIASYNKIFTFDFEIKTIAHQSIEHSIEYTVQRYQFQPVLNDEITLKQNEIYGVRIDISRWFNFQKPGEYIIKGLFYPNLITDQDKKVISSSNELFLDLYPAYTEEVLEKVREEKVKKLEAQSLPPYEVIDFILKALIEKDFEKYFLYIKFEKFIMQFENARQKYLNASDEKKPEVIEEFKAYLKSENELEEIPFSDTIPIDYDIKKTVIEKRDATVTVIETFKFGRLVEKKLYTYYLHKYGDLWLVNNYDVVNIGI